MTSFKDLPQGLIDAVTKILEDEAKELCPECGKPMAECICEMAGSEGVPNMYEDEDKDAPKGEGEVIHGDSEADDEHSPETSGIKEEDEEEKKDKEDSVKEQWEKAAALKENVAVDSDALASSEPRSALGQRDSEYPKHVDVVKETDFIPRSAEGSKVEGFRLLCQYSTNSLPEYIPSLDLPAAPTLEALSALVPGEPEIAEAIRNALDLPHERPNFSGEPPFEE